MKLFIFTFKFLLTLLFFTAIAVAQQINPATQIAWPGCTPGQVYEPSGNLCTSSSGSMTWPAVSGVACYSGSSSWCTSYSATNPLPANYISTLNQNTTGTAANLSGTPVLPNGTTATTQTAGDNSANLATTAFVTTAVAGAHGGTTTNPLSFSTSSSTASGSFNGSAAVTIDYADVGAAPLNSPALTGTPSAQSLGLTNVYTATLSPAAQTANYTLSVPTLTANDTVATLGVNESFTGKITTAASTTTQAGLNVPPGVTPSAPVAGDLWGLSASPELWWRHGTTNYLIPFTNSINAWLQPQTFYQAVNLNNITSVTQQGFANYPAMKFTVSPYSGGTGSSTVPQLAQLPGGATAVTTWNTGGTFYGINAASTFAGNFMDFHVNGGTSVFTVNASGGVLGTGLGNQTSLTIAAGAAAGTGATIACAANTTCGWNGGVINILVGTSPTTGVAFTITDAITHPNYPACTYEIFPANSSYVKTGPQLALTTQLYDTNASFTVQTYNLSSALTTAAYYVVNYTCIGE